MASAATLLRRALLGALHGPLLAAVLGGAAVGAQQRVVVASKNFAESNLLAEMMVQVLQARTDLEVEHQSGLGGTLICFTALESGEVDLYPEYTGTGWSVLLKEPERATDALRTYLLVQAACRERFDVEWLQPFGFDNTYAIAMTERRAEELGVRTLSDLAPHAAELTAGLSIEFLNREDGWPGLAALYGLEDLDVRGMEHALAYQAIDTGTVDVVDAYATDGKLQRYDLRVLTDDRRYFPPYDAAPVVRGELLRAHPEVGEALGALAFRLTNERMVQLNYRIEVEGEDVRAVARSFLAEEGLLAAAPEEEVPTGRAGFAAFFVDRWSETLRLLGEHVRLTLSAVLLAAALSIPLGLVLVRHAWAQRLGLGAAGVVQTIPSLALLAILIAVPFLGLTERSAVVALTLYAILPILRNTVTGLQEVEPELLDAARGMGLEPLQVLLRVQLPLATRTIMAGVRTATVITIGFATLAAFIGAGGLGEPIVTGLYLNDTRLILSGALPAAGLALLADALLGRVERWLTPRGLRIARA